METGIIDTGRDLFTAPSSDPTNRSQLAPKTFLAGYNGYLQADAYPGYAKLYQDSKIIEVACFAHMRRKFIEIQEAVKGETLADDAIKLIADIYAIETKTKDFTYLNRYYYRKKHARPEKLFVCW